MPPPFKNLRATFHRIAYLNEDSVAILQTDNELLKNYQVHLKKGDNNFSITINFVPFKGFSSTMLDSIKLPPPIELSNGLDTYYLPEHALLIHSTSYKEPHIVLNGSISQITTIEDETQLTDQFIRLVIPVGQANPNLRLVHGYVYENDLNKNTDPLLKVNIHNEEFHFYEINQAVAYLAIESTTPVGFDRFKKIATAIINAFGFLSGHLYLDEGYFLISNSAEFDAVQHIYYTSYRESIHTDYGIYTTNPFSLYHVTATTKDAIKKQSEEIGKWYKKVPEFSQEIFSILCGSFFDKEAFSRGAIVLLQGNNLALEIKGSAYSVALESITNQLLKEKNISYPKPIEDVTKSESVVRKLKEVVDLEFAGAAEPQNTIRRILNSRINNLNSPSNADKLSRPFSLFGYSLSEYEKKVLKGRDLYQHGKLPAKTMEDENAFKEVYFSCIVLHRLIVTLVLKSVGYSGFIINYPQLHKQITGQDLGEEFFYPI